MDRLQLIDCLGEYYKYIVKHQPVVKEKLLDCFETLCSQNNMPLEYHRISLQDIMAVAGDVLGNK